MVYSLLQISEIAINGLSEDDIEAIKRDDGEVLVVPDRTDDCEPKDMFGPKMLDLLTVAARRFRDAGFSCEFSVSLDEFLSLAADAKFDKTVKAFADLWVKLRILPVCLSAVTLAEVLTDEQCDLFQAATDACRAAGLDCTFDAQRFTVEQTLSASRKLNAWRHEIKNASVNGTPLSPFEKFLYAYDVVSQFRYNEVDDGEDMDLSRKLIYVLSTDKIVCVGFSALFVHILGAVGIASEMLFLEETQRIRAHATCLVYIKDDKYGLGGFFISDPTFGTPNAERDQNVYFAVIPPSSAKKIYGDCPALDDLDWVKGMLYDRVYGREPQLSSDPTPAEVQEYMQKCDEYYRLKTEIAAKEPSGDLTSALNSALVKVALAEGMTEAQAQTFAAARLNARFDGLFE